MYNRRSTPKVKDGKVQRKNRSNLTVCDGYVLDRQSPLHGYRHVVTKKDVGDFIELIPNWDDLAIGIERILLSRGGGDYDGIYETFDRSGTSIIELSAWKKELWFDMDLTFFEDHKMIFELIELPHTRNEEHVVVMFNIKKAKAFMLLHVFLHELGHHHDRMTTKIQESTIRGESYAEDFANEMSQELFPKYLERFELN